MAIAFASIVTLLSQIGMPQVVADEMAWGDVSADGSLQTRSLDVPVPMARGAENFFEQDPMLSHDWTHVSVVQKSLQAQISLAAAAKPGSRVRRLEEALRPIYNVMPKDESGRLSNGTVRYALHRYFAGTKGWAMKGLQPAGGSWIKSMSVTPDVKELSKYMVPTYLQDLLMQQLDGQGMDLSSLAILAATLEHLIHGEMLDILHSVYTTLGLSTARGQSETEVDDIVDLFVMVYAFGFNLEASTQQDMVKARQHLESKHSGWPPLRVFAESIKKNVMMQQASGSNLLDFNGVLQIAQGINNQYAQWQSQDCTRAKELLLNMADSSTGRVPTWKITPSVVDGGRPLFTESLEELQKLGVTDGDHLIVPNYIYSQSMCLSTVSFHTACCPNECESLLGSLELDAGSPAIEAERLAELIAMRAPNLPSPLSALKEMAAQGGGVVPLHTQSFARLMHQWFPMQCPLPTDMPTTNPKTADEWMKEPDETIQDTEDMMSEIAAVLAKYTAMGEYVAPSEEPQDEVPDGTDVVLIRDSEQAQSRDKKQAGAVFYVLPVVSMLGIAMTALKTGISATSLGPKGKEKSFNVEHMA